MSEGSLSIDLMGQEVVLDREKVLYWKEAQMLIASDVHLGKAGHFRKHGIPVPSEIHFHDLLRLERLIRYYNPITILFLGDLFHSAFNEEWLDLLRFRKKHSDIQFLLVQGNHDILNADIYHSSGIAVVHELRQPPFHFTHEEAESTLYNLSGHVHPAIRLHGYARQGLTLPCFFFRKKTGILPAFGKFTGTYKIRPVSGSRVYAVSDDQVIELV